MVNTFDEAVADIPDGASIMIGGFGSKGGLPQNLILALSRRDVGNLTIIGNSPLKSDVASHTLKRPYTDASILLVKKQVSRVIASYPIFTVRRVARSMLEEQVLAGEVEMEIVPQGTLAERIRAGGVGLGGFYTPTGVGTALARGKEAKTINGKEYILELPLTADYSFIRAHRADTMGNLTYRKASRNFSPIMATASDITIAEVDDIVEPGELDPEAVVTPGIYVKRIVKIPEGGA